MDMRTGLGHDLLLRVVDWRLSECLALRTPRGVERKTEVVSTTKATRAAFIHAVAEAATRDRDPGDRISGPPLTTDDAEIILAPLVTSMVFWGNKSWTHNCDLRAERASLLSFARAWAPQVARYCIDPADELAVEVDALAMFVGDRDLSLANLDESQRCAFRRQTTTPTAHRSRLMGFIANLTSEETLITEGRVVIAREFPNPNEASVVAYNASLNDPVTVAAILAELRERAMRHIPDALTAIWPHG